MTVVGITLAMVEVVATVTLVVVSAVVTELRRLGDVSGHVIIMVGIAVTVGWWQWWW